MIRPKIRFQHLNLPTLALELLILDARDPGVRDLIHHKHRLAAPARQRLAIKGNAIALVTCGDPANENRGIAVQRTEPVITIALRQLGITHGCGIGLVQVVLPYRPLKASHAKTKASTHDLIAHKRKCFLRQAFDLNAGRNRTPKNLDASIAHRGRKRLPKVFNQNGLGALHRIKKRFRIARSISAMIGIVDIKRFGRPVDHACKLGAIRCKRLGKTLKAYARQTRHRHAVQKLPALDIPCFEIPATNDFQPPQRLGSGEVRSNHITGFLKQCSGNKVGVKGVGIPGDKAAALQAIDEERVDQNVAQMRHVADRAGHMKLDFRAESGQIKRARRACGNVGRFKVISDHARHFELAALTDALENLTGACVLFSWVHRVALAG